MQASRILSEAVRVQCSAIRPRASNRVRSFLLLCHREPSDHAACSRLVQTRHAPSTRRLNCAVSDLSVVAVAFTKRNRHADILHATSNRVTASLFDVFYL